MPLSADLSHACSHFIEEKKEKKKKSCGNHDAELCLNGDD